jgi:hypothetical protein
MTKQDAINLLYEAINDWHCLHHLDEIDHPDNSFDYQAVLEDRQQQFDQFVHAIKRLDRS